MTDDGPGTALEDDSLASTTGGARIPAYTPEFTNPRTGDPGHAAHELSHTIQQAPTSDGASAALPRMTFEIGLKRTR